MPKKEVIELVIGRLVGTAAIGAVSEGKHPGLVTLARQGAQIDNVAQISKSGMGLTMTFAGGSKTKCRIVNNFF